MTIVNTETGELASEAEVDASIARVIAHADSIWNEWAWQVENRTWLVKGYASWDEMRQAVYTNLNGVTAPRAERPELVSRFRAAGLTQQETAETLGVSQRTVSNYDEPRQEHPAKSSNFATPAVGPEPEIVDAEIVEDHEAAANVPEAADPEPFGWDRTYESFRELAKHLKKNPSPEQRERLARGLRKLLKEITA